MPVVPRSAAPARDPRAGEPAGRSRSGSVPRRGRQGGAARTQGRTARRLTASTRAAFTKPRPSPIEATARLRGWGAGRAPAPALLAFRTRQTWQTHALTID